MNTEFGINMGDERNWRNFCDRLRLHIYEWMTCGSWGEDGVFQLSVHCKKSLLSNEEQRFLSVNGL